MKYESRTIRKAVNEIGDKKMVLPHIQRSFVWKYERNNNQIKRFFDSILRGHPIGTCCFGLLKMIFSFADLLRITKTVWT
jgi:uncharacterized protein with ParB-like and HNH nuclease domain